jgi:hypothetical protein
MRKLLIIWMVVAFAGLMTAGLACADPAVTFSNLTSTTTINSQETAGWNFTVSGGSISVTDLGVFDSGQTGLDYSHQVGIWNSSGQLLVSGTVPAGTAGTLVNQFYYVSVTTTVLGPGTYDIGANYTQYPGSTDNYLANASGFNTATGIKFNMAEYSADNSGGLLTDPNSISASFFTNGVFGPNFEFSAATTTAVPEPCTMLLLGSGLVGIAAFRKKFIA